MANPAPQRGGEAQALIDISAETFALYERRREQMALGLAELLLRNQADLHKRQAAATDLLHALHDAFLVDCFGVNSGLDPQRLQELRTLGFIPDTIWPSMRGDASWAKQDPASLAVGLGRMVEHAYSTRDDTGAIALLHADGRAVAAKLGTDGAKLVAASAQRASQVDAHELPHSHAKEAFLPPAPPWSGTHGHPGEFVPPAKPPGGVGGGVHGAAYREGVRRIGCYCRGLGDKWIESSQEWLGERWEADNLEHTPDPLRRAAMLKAIEAAVLNARDTHRNPRQLAHDLFKATPDFGREWLRIAKTELQALFNEEVISQAEERFGDDARICGIPETSACATCLSVFLGEDGLPRVWRVKDLLANGTNVGKARRDWKATGYPIHPECCCRLCVVPPDKRLNRWGLIIH